MRLALLGRDVDRSWKEVVVWGQPLAFSYSLRSDICGISRIVTERSRHAGTLVPLFTLLLLRVGGIVVVFTISPLSIPICRCLVVLQTFSSL